MTIIAVDIGGTNIRHALIDSNDFKILYRAPNITTPRENIDDLCTAVLKGINDLEKKLDGQKKTIAISSAGLVRPSDGSVIALSPAALPALTHRYPLKQKIESAAHASVVILNDGQAATFAEYRAAQKTKTDLENFMFVTVSTGTGGGLMLDGKLFSGKTGKAGHIGLAPLHGMDNGVLRTVEDISCGRFVDGDSSKISISAKTIATMIAGKVMELDIECVSIGGGVALGNPDYIDLVRDHLKHFGPARYADVIAAQYGDDAGIVGAAMFAATQA